MKYKQALIMIHGHAFGNKNAGKKEAIICSKLIINHCLDFLNNMFYSYGRL